MSQRIKHGPADLDSLLRTLIAARDIKRFSRIQFFIAYPKQQEFFDAGLCFDERLLMAGNQLGKTEAGAVEAVYHATGDYPDDWLGRRFTKPVKLWVCGETSQVVRDAQQKKLCGEPGIVEEFGTGYIPKDKFVGKPSMARGITDAFDTVHVRHKSGGVSALKFKSYEQGREKFQADTVDVVWFDEEPPMEVYSEGRTRLVATRGCSFMTFTPLKGMSEVVMRFLNEPAPNRKVITMTIDDALHIPIEERAAIIANYPAHEREARAKGIPMLGSGRIFPYSEESIREAMISAVPLEWAKIWGIDFGIGHAFGAVLCAWDRDADVFHILHTIRVKDQLPLQHWQAIKQIGQQVPISWPQDGTAREKSGEQVSQLYRKEGARMLPQHATWPEGGISTEKGILEMQDRMTTGKFKVAAHLSDWWEEFRLYHRKDGQIVKLHDDLMSATRIALMMRRMAKPVPLGGGHDWRKSRGREEIAKGVDFDPFYV